MASAIAVVGMACRYPDARTPVELWENVLAQRQAFRRLPDRRLNLADYLSDDPNDPDQTYSANAAVLADYAFDRERFRVAGSTFRSVDTTHWLALEVASDALNDAGFPDGEGLPRLTTGVLLGNSLAGEFSRANLMRLRWPFVRRIVDSALRGQNWLPQQRADFLAELAMQYKAPFPPAGDETLAGGLSNTIAGRICNYFDLHGGGYTVDGACASSLLAIANACSGLVAGDWDVALAGGVDLSLDPFELVGFAKVGALAKDEMRVFDAHPTGFWPGEGCGVVVLMRLDDAVRQHRRVYAVVHGWGISSDGSGGLTRPEVEGQLLALRRAYHRAGYGVETVRYFEGHGTGTTVGDATELSSLSRARKERPSADSPAVVGSLKANIGHTKAAAGVAGLIKAVMALRQQLLPPSTGWEEPHRMIAEEGNVLRLLKSAEAWPVNEPLRAGVSSMGFGGINAHLALEGIATRRRSAVSPRERMLLGSAQDAELFLLRAASRDQLLTQVRRLGSYAGQLSRSELSDLAAELAETLAHGSVRAALVASQPAELAAGLATLAAWLDEGLESQVDDRRGAMLGSSARPPAIGLMFPGQGTPASLDGGAWARRFDFVNELYQRAELPARGDVVATEVAQPAIVTASLAGLAVLDRLGIQAAVAIGHSLGELVAYHWAGAMDERQLLRIAAARGRAVAEFGRHGGAMASITAGAEVVEGLPHDKSAVLASLNSPRQTVIAGDAAAVDAWVARARAAGLTAVRLKVSHAFHSPLVADCAPALDRALSGERFDPLRADVLSTITGTKLDPQADLRPLLFQQLTSPVRFMEAFRRAEGQVDLWIEVGPGTVLRAIAADLLGPPAVALDAGGRSLRGLLQVVGRLFVSGAPVHPRMLFDDRVRRPFRLDWQPQFLTNPCELAPESDGTLPASTGGDLSVAGHDRDRVRNPGDSAVDRGPAPPVAATPEADRPSEVMAEVSMLETVRKLAAQRAELPLSAVKGSDRLLNDLHLSSIAVGQLFVEAARSLGLPPPASPADAANSTVQDLAEALAELAARGSVVGDHSLETAPPGVDGWTRAFSVVLVERPVPRRQAVSPRTGNWQVIASPGDPLQPQLSSALRDAVAGGGVVLCLPPDPDEKHLDLLLDSARAVLARREERDLCFVLVQHGGGAAAFARSLHLESPQVATCVVDVPPGHSQTVEWVLAEIRAAAGYSEAHYDLAGIRREPCLRLLQRPESEPAIPLDSDDVLLVTGGGKGIAAECAFSLARQTGVRLALIGRSHPEEDPELAANLQRFTAGGVTFQYFSADVVDAAGVQSAVRQVNASWGPVTAILHGAGTNVPQRLASLDREAFLRTLRPKVQGLSNLLAAVNPDTLRLLVTFGSVIARTGMVGEADYAVANDWLARATESWQAGHPDCHCLCVEWSVWSGVGMGERLGRVDALTQQGITPIPLDEGVRWLGKLIGHDPRTVSVVVVGRFGEPPTLKIEQSELPLLRFLEQPRVFVPGVELVADSRLSLTTDYCLRDHIYQGVPLLPAVMGMEAMAQVAMAVTGASAPPVLEEVRFDRPVAVSRDGETAIRLAALVRQPGQVEVVLRSEETGYQQNHFAGSCRFDRALNQSPLDTDGLGRSTEGCCNNLERVALDPRRDLYGNLLFHTGRFQRLGGFLKLRARECVAEIVAADESTWFGTYLPARLVLGDVAARDAAIHAVQACIPHHTVLPVYVERLWLATTLRAPLVVHATEVRQEGDEFIYELRIFGLDGRLVERWQGLRLRRVGEVAPHGDWPVPLFGPYLERRLNDLVPAARISVIVQENGGAGRRARSQQAIVQAVGAPVAVHHRPDGKPEVQHEADVSAAHAGSVTMAVVGPGEVGCDIEPVVVRRPDVWRDLLGAERFKLAEWLTKRGGDDLDTAATRMWTAAECLTKIGTNTAAPIVFQQAPPDGWVLVSSGRFQIATWATPPADGRGVTIFAVLVGADRESV